MTDPLTPNMDAPFFKDWAAEDWPGAVKDCLSSLRRCIPERNLSRSHRWAARDALEQARYLGLTKIGDLPPTVVRREPSPEPKRGQLELLEGIA